jgi:hypothetical protein
MLRAFEIVNLIKSGVALRLRRTPKLQAKMSRSQRAFNCSLVPIGGRPEAWSNSAYIVS